MRITQQQHQQLIDHALAELPNECVGMIACRGAQAKRIYPLTNVAEHPQTSYVAAAAEQYEVMAKIRLARFHLGAIYHSHPTGSGEPSKQDIRLAIGQPTALYLIISNLATAPIVRSFRIGLGGSVAEQPLYVIDNENENGELDE